MPVKSHEFGPGAIDALTRGLYPNKFDPFREAIANGFDEDSPRVDITICSDVIKIEDWGGGIVDMDTFIFIGHDTKKLRGKTYVIGEKGLGKLSLFNIGNEVVYYSNNGKFGIRDSITKLGGHDFIRSQRPDEFLDHRGVLIRIENPRGQYNIEDLTKYLQEVFMLKLVEGKKIRLNGIEILPNAEIDPKREPITRVLDEFLVEGNLKPADKNYGKVKIFIKGVYNSTMVIDMDRKFTGWVECNVLPPTTDRSNIVDDMDTGIKDNFKKQMRAYVQAHFAKAGNESNARFDKDQEKFLNDFIRNMKLNLVGESFGGKGNNFTKVGPDIPEIIVTGEGSNRLEEVRQKIQKELQKPAHRKHRLGPGLKWTRAKLGAEEPPYIAEKPNVCIKNLTSPLFEYTAKKTHGSNGSTQVRYIPYMARVIVDLFNETKFLTNEKYLQKVDGMTIDMLKQARLIDANV